MAAESACPEALVRLIYQLVLSFGSHVGSGFPVAYVLHSIERAGYSDAEFIAATDTLQEGGLLTKDDEIGDSFFEVLGAIYPGSAIQ